MEQKTLEDILYFENLGPGIDPSYKFKKPHNLYYLGLTEDLALESKCTSITLPMLSRKKLDWSEKLSTTLIELIKSKPQLHVASLKEAYEDFALRSINFTGIESKPNIWISNKSFTTKVFAQNTSALEENNLKERNINLNIPNKLVALIPCSQDLGLLCRNECFFNFYILSDRVFVYYINSMKVDS